jgi:Tfp pilus assembly protein FimT
MGRGHQDSENGVGVLLTALVCARDPGRARPHFRNGAPRYGDAAPRITKTEIPRMRSGFTLVDLMLALIIVASVLLFSVPSAGDIRDRLLVDQAAKEIVIAHERARLCAVAEGRVALLTIRQDSLRVDVVDGTDTLARWGSGGPLVAGVALTGAPRTVSFAPIGVSFGLANATYTLSRGSHQKQVVVSRYGRVRLQ